MNVSSWPVRVPSRRSALVVAVVAVLATFVIGAVVVRANPDHFAGDYFMFAKAAASGVTTDRKANEAACDTSNDKQADISGSGNHIYGRVHSNADLAISGTNIFHDTPSPDTELTYGANDNAPPPSSPDCQLQAESGNVLGSGAPLNIAANANPLSIEGPYQIGTGGWPGNLGDHLNADAQTFTTIEDALVEGSVCNVGSLTGSTTITVEDNATYENKVVCNGTGLIVLGDSDFGSAATPFRITMISHGPIDIGGSDQFLVPADAGHGILAMTDQRFIDNPTAIKIGGSNVNIPRRSILFSPRSGQDVSGSVNSTLCIQMIGQGALKAGGSSAHFGPLSPGCGAPAEIVTQVHASVTGNAHFNLGGGLSAIEVGTQIHDRAVLTSHTSPASSLTGTIVANRYNNGTCAGEPFASATFTSASYTPGTTVTIDDILPFTPAVGVYSYRVDYGGDTNKNLATVGSCEGPVHVVDASVAITPASAANEVGQDHDMTVTVTVSGGSIATAGADVTATKESGPGTLDPGTCNTATAAPPDSCDVTLKSTAPGASVVSASASIPIDVNGDGTADITLTRATGTTAQSGAATKTWVAVRIGITPASAANEVGTNHLLTISLEKATAEDANGPIWVGIGAQCVTASLTNSNGANAAFVDGDLVNADCNAGLPGDVGEGDACTTGASGTCTVTITSATAGTTTVAAGWSGGTIDGAVIGPKTTDPDATKNWVAVRIGITPPSDANEVGTNHVLTVTLEKATAEDANGPIWVGLGGQCVTATLANSDGATASFVDTDAAPDCNAGSATDLGEGDACTTDVAGVCTVTISSNTAGNSSVQATWAGGTVDGAVIAPKTTSPATKAWVAVRISIAPLEATNPVGTTHDLTITLEQSVVAGTWTPLNGQTVTATITVNAGGATAVFVGSNTCVTAGAGQCIVTISSATAGTTTVEATWAGGTVGGAAITAKTTEPDALKHWVASRSTLLIIDEDSLDNGIHFNPTGGLIVPSGPSFFSTADVNDDRPGLAQRQMLLYFQQHVGATITVKTGQTNDEGWFAPTCIPQKWISGTSNTCIADLAQRNLAIGNYFGAAVPPQNRLDRIPAVMPLRALGLVELIGQNVCAVVYDSDISINYPSSRFPFTEANLQGQTLGIVAFRVDAVTTLNGFSSSTLPQVTLTINSASTCGNWQLLNAPVPRSSSVPNDRLAESPVTSTGSNGYRQLKVYPTLPLFN